MLKLELRPEYIKKLKRIRKGKYIGPFTSIEELDKYIKHVNDLVRKVKFVR